MLEGVLHPPERPFPRKLDGRGETTGGEKIGHGSTTCEWWIPPDTCKRGTTGCRLAGQRQASSATMFHKP
eukprot:3748643-Alexandrium_andersonii.AAC.1